MAEAPLRVTDRDPNEILSVPDACRFLDVSRPTIYRLPLRRVPVSAGRVGYRAGDLVEHVRRGADDPASTGGQTNCWVADHGVGMGADELLTLPPRINTILRRRSRSKGVSLGFAIELPPARELWKSGRRDLLVVDVDGLNAIEPTVVIAAEGEELRRSGEANPRPKIMLTVPHAIVRLTAVFGWPEKMPDGWLVS